MAQSRNQRIESEIQRVLSALIAREVKDPRVGNVTITAVTMLKDKSAAKIFFTPFASVNPPEQVRIGLTHAGGFLRGELGRRLGLRHAPRLEFLYDDTVEGAAHLTGLIEKAVAGDRAHGSDAPAEGADATPPTATSRAADPAHRLSMHSGVLLLDKPLGLSSNAALQRVRSLFGREKAGHVGSLDPLATGMLPICLGEATKIAGDILSGRKCYRFTAALGRATSTGDTEGEVTRTAPVPALSAETVRAALRGFEGTGTQVPPMYSALKQGGQPLYKLARAGISVPRAARTIELSSIQLLGFTAETLEIEVLCSKGTYVRVLAEDIADALGTCAHVTALRRLWVEPFAAKPMHTLGRWRSNARAGSGRRSCRWTGHCSTCRR